MKFALLFFIAFSTAAVSWADKSAGSYTRFHLSPAQIEEFDETGWVTLTPSEKAELLQRTGISPTRVRPIYDRPDGEVAELGYNLALKTAIDEIEVLHKYLMSDEDVAKKYKKSIQLVTASKGIAQELPEFAIDSQGRIWKFISRQEYEDYVVRDPKSIGLIYFYMPTCMPAKNTVAAEDTLRQLSNYCKSKNVSSDVITVPSN